MGDNLTAITLRRPNNYVPANSISSEVVPPAAINIHSVLRPLVETSRRWSNETGACVRFDFDPFVISVIVIAGT